MVFGFFSRKPQQPPETVPLPPSPSASTSNQSPDSGSKVEKNVQLRTPSPSVDSASAAYGKVRSASPTTKISRLSIEEGQTSPTRRGSFSQTQVLRTAIAPNPAFVPPEATVESLTAHIGAIPAKALHAYVLARIPRASPESLPVLAEFFSELAPPPKLHCVRCHKDYAEVENDDRSCLVPHDDESAEVERVGTTKRANRIPGTVGATFETLWGCCGKIVEGDGDQGPPDGWCYEGKHTVRVDDISCSIYTLSGQCCRVCGYLTYLDGHQARSLPCRLDAPCRQARLVSAPELPRHPRTITAWGAADAQAAAEHEPQRGEYGVGRRERRGIGQRDGRDRRQERKHCRPRPGERQGQSESQSR